MTYQDYVCRNLCAPSRPDCWCSPTYGRLGVLDRRTESACKKPWCRPPTNGCSSSTSTWGWLLRRVFQRVAKQRDRLDTKASLRCALSAPLEWCDCIEAEGCGPFRIGSRRTCLDVSAGGKDKFGTCTPFPPYVGNARPFHLGPCRCVLSERGNVRARVCYTSRMPKNTQRFQSLADDAPAN